MELHQSRRCKSLPRKAMKSTVQCLMAIAYTPEGDRDKTRDDWVTEHNVELPEDLELRAAVLKQRFPKAIQIKVYSAP
jgi:hypothetical protein